MGTKRIEKIRAAVIALKRDGRRPRYAEWIQSAVKRLMSEEVGLSELVHQTGISRGTLIKWSKDLPTISQKFRAIDVESSADDERARSESALRVILPSGVSIECVSIAALRQVLEQCP